MLISFEGIDGSGKTTQITLLRERLGKEKIPVEVLREPGGTPLSEMIRSVLLNPEIQMNPVTELLLFSAARSELVTQKILPLLKDGIVVILDRFYDSTLAYQGFGRGSLSIGEIHKLNKIASHLTTPDITFYLDIEVKHARERRKNMDEDRMERSGESFYERVREGFRYLAAKEKRVIGIDGKLPPEEIHQLIWKRVSAMIGSARG